MKALLLSNQQQNVEKITFAVESQVNGELLCVKTIQDALAALCQQDFQSQADRVDLLIYDYRAGSPDQFGTFWAVAANTPAIVCGKKDHRGAAESVSQNLLQYIEAEDPAAEIVQAVQGAVAKGLLEARAADHGYCRVKTSLLLEMNPLQASIYVRLNDEKFVRLFQPGDEFELSDLDKYRDQKGIDYLYLKEDEVKAFLDKLQVELGEALTSNEVSIEKTSGLGSAVHDSVRDLNDQLGFTSEIQNAVKMQIQLTVKTMAKNNRLQELIGKIKTEGKYIGDHSTAIAMMACGIANRTDWGSDETGMKLAYAAFLHDITLKNHDLARCQSIAEVEEKVKAGEISEQELKDYRFHTIRAAEISKGFQEVPHDVDKMIQQHHERPSGKGFPQGLRFDQIAPLSAIFIVAHELYLFMERNGRGFEMDDFLYEMSSYYKGHFESILESMRFD